MPTWLAGLALLAAAVHPARAAEPTGDFVEINGATMCELDDRDPRRLLCGVLALQVHTGPPMTVQFKDIRYRRL